MKKILIILTALLLTAILSCDDDSAAEKKYKGKLTVTVNTSADLWDSYNRYPFIDTDGPHTLASTSADPKDGTWMYPEVGGVYWYTVTAGWTGDPCIDDPGVEDLADTNITAGDIGDKINVVYLYSTLGERSVSTPVLYRGVSSSNPSTITIGNIAPGDYYIVAFYDYNSGGNRENLLNRYDRYSFYDTAHEGTGTPFVNEADTVTVNEDSHDITLAIDADWALGRPKYIADFGRGFMNSDPGDDDRPNTAVPERDVICP